MPLYKWVRDEVDKLSYVNRTEFKKATFFIYYDYEGKEKFRALPYRVNKNQLLNVLQDIRNELNLQEKKREEFKKQTKPMMVHVPWKNAGETDGKRKEDSTSKDS